MISSIDTRVDKDRVRLWSRDGIVALDAAQPLGLDVARATSVDGSSLKEKVGRAVPVATADAVAIAGVGDAALGTGGLTRKRDDARDAPAASVVARLGELEREREGLTLLYWSFIVC